MSSSEDFKQALRDGKLNDALAIAISQVPELKITTSITSSTPNSASRQIIQKQRLLHPLNVYIRELT